MENKRITIIDLLNNSVGKYAKNPFLWEKLTTEFTPTTYEETRTQAQEIAAGLLSLGIKNGEKIALLSEGRNAWIISELGILYTGAVNVPLSIKLEESNDLVFRILHSESRFIFVSGGQLKKIRTIVAQLPDIEKIIVFDDQTTYENKEMSIRQLVLAGKEITSKNPGVVEERAKTIQPDDLATIS